VTFRRLTAEIAEHSKKNHFEPQMNTDEHGFLGFFNLCLSVFIRGSFPVIHSANSAISAVKSQFFEAGNFMVTIFDLAPCGVYLAFSVTRKAVRSYRTFSPLPSARHAWRYIFCGTFPGIAPGPC
jgi:hypothetical protein